MNISVFLAPGFEEIEALAVVDYLRRAGQNVVSVSLQESVIHAGGAGQTVVTGSHGISVVADIELKGYEEYLNGSLPDVIYLPGGMPGAENLSKNQFCLILYGKWLRAEKLWLQCVHLLLLCLHVQEFLLAEGGPAIRKWKMSWKNGAAVPLMLKS